MNASGDRIHLDQWFPELNRKKVWVASDWVLDLYNSDSPKERRPFTEQWWENSRVWMPFITEAEFLVRNSGEILDILKVFKDKLLNDPVARGDPRLFAWHLILYSCCNEDKFERDANWEECAEYLKSIPEGLVTSFGPADNFTWWPQYASPKTAKWDKLSTGYFNILADKSRHPWIRGTAPMRTMSLRTGVDKRGVTWVNKHFADTRKNTFRMPGILTTLMIFQQFSCNSRELATRLGRLPPSIHQVRWERGFCIVPNPDFELGVTRRREQQEAENAAAAAKFKAEVLEQLSQMCGLIRPPSVGDKFCIRAASEGQCNQLIYLTSSMEVVAGHLGPKTSFGPLLQVEVYQRCTDTDLFAGIAVLLEHECPVYPDPARTVQPQGQVWIAVSENSTLLCCLIEDGKKSIWDDTDEEAETVGATWGSRAF